MFPVFWPWPKHITITKTQVDLLYSYLYKRSGLLTTLKSSRNYFVLNSVLSLQESPWLHKLSSFLHLMYAYFN